MSKLEVILDRSKITNEFLEELENSSESFHFWKKIRMNFSRNLCVSSIDSDYVSLITFEGNRMIECIVEKYFQTEMECFSENYEYKSDKRYFFDSFKEIDDFLLENNSREYICSDFYLLADRDFLQI